MPTFVRNVISQHALAGPKRRRYVFRVHPGEVSVERQEGDHCSSRTLCKADAHKLYLFLINTHGYRKELRR